MGEIKKEVFLSATYDDQRDCIEEVKSKLAELGVKAYHFKEGHFYDGQIHKHSHDRCIELVETIPNYLLIVSFNAGSFYAGQREEYRGLTITHAEFKAAVNAYNPARRIFSFVRRDVWNFYKEWKIPLNNGRVPPVWEIDKNLFPLLQDLEEENWADIFDISLDLKHRISEKRDYFVETGKKKGMWLRILNKLRRKWG